MRACSGKCDATRWQTAEVKWVRLPFTPPKEKKREVHKMVEKLQKAGHSDAKPIIGGGKMRVCIASYATMDEANEAAKQQQSTYNGAWVLKK